MHLRSRAGKQQKASAPEAKQQTAAKRRRQAAKSGSEEGGDGERRPAKRQQRQQQRAAGSGKSSDSAGQAWVICCSRQSKVVKWDEETFEDCYGDEAEGPRDEVEGCTEAGNGTWYHNAGNKLQQVPSISQSHHRIVNTSGTGRVTVFQSLDAANKRAALVWADMQHYYFEEWRPAGVDGHYSTDESMFQEGREEEEESCPDTEEEESSNDEDWKEGSEYEGAGRGAASSTEFKTVLPDGRCRWERERYFFCDPFTPGPSGELKNLIRSITTVEVQQATLVA